MWIIRRPRRILGSDSERQRRAEAERLAIRKTLNIMSRTVPGLVLPPAARDASALHKHIPSFDVLQAADVAASRRSGSRTRERGRDLRIGGAATLWIVHRARISRKNGGMAARIAGNGFHERFTWSYAPPVLRYEGEYLNRKKGTRREKGIRRGSASARILSRGDDRSRILNDFENLSSQGNKGNDVENVPLRHCGFTTDSPLKIVN